MANQIVCSQRLIGERAEEIWIMLLSSDFSVAHCIIVQYRTFQAMKMFYYD